MKAQKLPLTVTELPIAEVEWEDAARDPNFDGPMKDVQHGPVINQTVGYVVKDDRYGVTLATDRSPEPGENTVRWTYTIPRRYIKRISRLTPIQEKS